MAHKQAYNPNSLIKVRQLTFIGVFDFYYLG